MDAPSRPVPSNDALDSIASLADATRRRLYALITERDDPLTRDEAARLAGIARPLAAFHLDRLVDAGLLSVDYRRPPGRGGPGAGRPAKRYRRIDRDVAVSLPERRYQLAAELFAAGLTREGTNTTADTVDQAARSHGDRLGHAARRAAGVRPSRARLTDAAIEALAGEGFEPILDAPERSARRPAGSTVRLRNCPFHALVADHRDLTCGMNLALMEGFVEGLGLDGATARLDPKPDRCCVLIDLPQRASG